MNCLRLPILRSHTVIQEDISPSFTCVLMCHKISQKGKCQNLIIFNSVVGVYVPAYWLNNTNVHRLLNTGQLPTTALTKRVSIIFLWAEFSRRAPIPMFNPILNIFCIFRGRWDAYSYSASPKNNKRIDCFRNGILSLC